MGFKILSASIFAQVKLAALAAWTAWAAWAAWAVIMKKNNEIMKIKVINLVKQFFKQGKHLNQLFHSIVCELQTGYIRFLKYTKLKRINRIVSVGVFKYYSYIFLNLLDGTCSFKHFDKI